MSSYRQIPYGISDFRQLRREDWYYVDKTMYIQRLEESTPFKFLVRPRRFGKSVFLSMMQAYYDINLRDQFQEIFKGLWIADHPTPLQGTFQVLTLDFSLVLGSIDTLEQSFGRFCNVVLDDFAKRYEHLYYDGFAADVKAEGFYGDKFNKIYLEAKERQHPLYLIVDEYDNFTNNVLNVEGEAVYHALTHGEGFYRGVFKLFKAMFNRVLMMGVSPVTMDDLTSGYNVALNITQNSLFNQMLGFSEDDVRQMIRYYQDEGKITCGEEELIAEMKPWYDNYCFSGVIVDSDPKMFNCDMVLYYLHSVVTTGKSPKQMIDPNTRTDYRKMQKLIRLDQLDGNRLGVLHEIASKGYIINTLKESFPASELTDPDTFVSLLFYYGMLTIGELYGAKLKLIIPNNNVRLQYYNYLMEEYRRILRYDHSHLDQAYDQAALNGDWQPMLQEIAKAYEQTTSVRQLIEGERNLQGFMNAYLTLTPYYLTAPEMELNHGFCDFFLMPDLSRYPMIRHSYILELKYLKADATNAEAAAQWTEAEAQIRQYAQAPMVQKMMGNTTLHLLIMQIRGYQLVRAGKV